MREIWQKNQILISKQLTNTFRQNASTGRGITSTNRVRTSEEEDKMLQLSLASLWHWTQREDCTPTNLSDWVLAGIKGIRLATASG